MTPADARKALRLDRKRERCAKANEVIRIISEHGRRFFHHTDRETGENRVGRFEVDGKGHVWFTDAFTQKRIWTHYPHGWKGFANGGTLLTLCKAIRDYIRTGTPVNAGYFGPWPWLSYKCLWGYGDDMEIVRQKVKETGAVG